MEIPGSRKITFPQPVYGRKHIAARTWYPKYPLHRTEASENEEHQKQDYSDSQCIFSITTHIISVGAIDQIIDTALHDTERYNRQAKHSEQNIDQTIILGSIIYSFLEYFQKQNIPQIPQVTKDSSRSVIAVSFSLAP